MIKLEKKEEPQDIKIGELLVAVGIVTTADLQEAIQIGRRMRLPIGRVIVISGLTSENNLHYALEAQSLVRDGLLDLNTAIKALKHGYKFGKSLQDALADLHWIPKDVQSNKLGELLIAAGLLTHPQLEYALQTSADTGLPLGGILVSQGHLLPQLLPALLNAQEQIRAGKIDRQRAVESLKTASIFLARTANNTAEGETYLMREETISLSFAPPEGVQQAAGQVGESTQEASCTLADLAVFSGYCSSTELQRIMLTALQNTEIAEMIFMSSGVIDKPSLNNILRAYLLVAKGILTQEQAISALNICRNRRIELDKVLEEMGIAVS